MEQRSEIRRIGKRARAMLPESTRAFYSKQIVSHVVRHSFFQECDTVCCYVACREEADLSGVMDIAWKLEKQVAVPKVLDGETMEFFVIDSVKKLSPGAFGIPEPHDCISPWQPRKGEKALILLPGLAFDREGNRLGYGRGYYDRYLDLHPYRHTMGIAFSVQCMEHIPAQPHDRKVETVITEKGRYEL